MKPILSLLTLVILFLASCTNPLEPDEVVKKWETLMSEGKCEEAKTLWTSEGQEVVQGAIDAGCEPYALEIKSIVCTTEGDEAYCTCYQNRSQKYDLSFHYNLVRIDGEWKIDVTQKDEDY